MWKMLQLDSPEDFLICTGESSSLREIVYTSLLVWEYLLMLCRLIPLYRPADHNIYGSPDYAAEKLGWRSSLMAKL